MKNCNFIYILLCLFYTYNLLATRIPENEIKVWLELDAIKQKINAQINKQAKITDETNSILEYGIKSAEKLGTHDQNEILAIYYDMQKLKNETKQINQNIEIINKKNKKLSNYIDEQIKELTNTRRKHLQFP